MSAAHRAPANGKWNFRLAAAVHRCVVEQLESRQLLSAAVGYNSPAVASAFATVPAIGTASPTGLSATQIRHAYGFDQITGTGVGQTIAIVDAYYDPSITSNLQTFDAQYGLTNPVFVQMDQNGETRPAILSRHVGDPDPSYSWDLETALDVEWAHVVAPDAKIILVEALDSSTANLVAAVNTARYLDGVSTISMSWGGAEDTATYGYYDRFMLTPATHQPETFIAASGDAGVAEASWPATSPFVLSVGGTKLNLTNTNDYSSEGVWIGSQGGESLYEKTPAYQASISKTLFRATPDVSYNADPASGVSIYNTTGQYHPTAPLLDAQGNPVNDANGNPIIIQAHFDVIDPSVAWTVEGGTSAGAPQWAGFIADVDEERVTNGLATLDGPNNTLPALYGIALQKKTRYQAEFNDIASGQNGAILAAELPTNPIPLNTVPIPHDGGFTGLPAKPGYDMATGLGTPKVANLSEYLAAFVPVKHVHRSPRQRARAAAAATAVARPAIGNTQMGAQIVSAGDTVQQVVATPVAQVEVQTNTPAAYVTKPIVSEAHLIDTVLTSDLPVSTNVAVTTETAPVTTTIVNGSHVTSDEVPVTNVSVENAAAVQTESAAIFETTFADYASVAQIGSSLATAAAAVVRSSAVKLKALPVQPMETTPKMKTISLKTMLPAMVGVVAADAIFVNKVARDRAEKKKRKARSPFAFNGIVPQEEPTDVA